MKEKAVEKKGDSKLKPTPYSDSLRIMTLSMMAGEILALSDFNQNEINSLLALIVLDKQLDLDIASTIVPAYAKMKVSYKRKGREEIMKAGQQKTHNILQLFTRKRTPMVEEPIE